MAEIFKAIVGIFGASTQIKEYVIIPLKNQYSYLFRYNNIVEGLRDKNQKLNSSRDHLQQQIQAAENNNQVILPHVRDWCGDVDELKKKADRILGDEQQDQNGACMHGTCPNLKLRYSLSREAMKLTKGADELQKEYREFIRSHIADLAPAPPMGTETSDTLDFTSRRCKEEEIMSYLRDSSIRMIGVWGMGGVGKTTMAEKIAKKAIVEKLFDKRATAVVSQQVDIRKIQQELAEGLGLHLTRETELGRAGELEARLKDKKDLIILDDVWNWLDLKKVGIPSQIKILLTSRDHQVCEMMSIDGATKILPLEVLDGQEAFSLFCKKAGSVVDQSNLRPLAINVAKECKGLPLALETVGRSLSGETDELIWKESLRQLQKAAPVYIRGYLKDVFQPLEPSYKHLESDEARYLFLLCCLFPEDSKIEIENLVRYGVGLRIFSPPIESINDARNRVHYLVKMLIDRCLLIDADVDHWGGTYVKMHDVIRDMALSIASSGKHVFMVSHDRGLGEWPGNDSGEDYTCISLTPGEALAFPECIRCPRLNALLLTFHSSTPALKLPVNFLNEIADVRLFSINRQGRYDSFLPLSLSFLSPLKNLRALHLDECDPENIYLIGQLVSLEILSCRGSGIRVLPNEIGALAKLKLLDLTDSRDLKNVAPGVISKLVKLEELRLMECPIEWEGKEEGKMRSNASLAEVFSLRNLRLLEIWILDSVVISQETDRLQNLTSYFIVIGFFYKYRIFNVEGSHTDLKRMTVCVNERKVFVNTISMLFRDVEELSLEGNGSKALIDPLARQEFKSIKHLRIKGLDSVKHLAPGSDIFPVLRHLDLREMNDLEEISHGPPSVGSFSQLEHLSLYDLGSLLYLWTSVSEKFCLSNLKKIEIQRCKNLKCVFPLSVAESLCRLESIEVWNCPMMEEVFKDERGSETGVTSSYHICLSNLEKIEIKSCKNLKWVFPLSIAESLCRLESIEVWGCPMMEEVFKDQRGSETGVTTNNHICLSNLKTIDIRSCENLKWVFPPSIAESLCRLERIRVWNCPMMEKVFNDERGSETGVTTSNHICLSNLKKIEIQSCKNLKWVFPLSIAKSLCRLQSILVLDCPMMEEVFKDERGSETGVTTSNHIKFPSLNRMILWGLPMLCALCKAVDVFECPSMETLKITELDLGLGQVKCLNLSYLDMSGLGMEIFYREVHMGIFTKLQVLEITYFDSLRTLFSLDVFRGLINLRKLIVKCCLMLEDIVKMEESEDEGHRNGTSKIIIPKLERLFLSELPKIRYFCSFRNALELPSLGHVWIEDCSMMETFALNLSCSSSMSNSSIPKFFLSKQVTCPNLHCLSLLKLKVCGQLFSHEIPITSLGALWELKVESCDNLKSLFTPRTFGGLTNLESLEVGNCLMLEEVIAKEDVVDDEGGREIEEVVVTLPKLCILKLNDLPKLRGFSHMHRDLELPSLKQMEVCNCTKMNTAFSLGRGSVRMPKGAKVVGMGDPEFASKLFFKGEQRKLIKA